MNILSLIVLAMIGEAVWETLKMTWQKGKINVDRIGALVIGITLSVSTELNIMTMVNIKTKFNIIGVVLTGVLISRGANFVHDLITGLNNISNNNKEKPNN